MTIRQDLMGKTPKIGDIIAYNPAHYKGIVLGYVTDFKKPSGLPTVIKKESFDSEIGSTFEEKLQNFKKKYSESYSGNTPKTGFVIITNN
jgi:hypothetical protein